MAKKYELKIENVGGDVYMLLSRGHHDIHEFMKQVRLSGYDWPLGTPIHVWFKATPNNTEGGVYYNQVNEDTIGAFPATFVVEEYGEDQYPNQIYWNGKNLKEMIEFTGKAKDFDKWFPTWECYAEHVKNDGNKFKIIRESSSEIANVGDWIHRDEEGFNSVLSSN